MSSHTSSSMPLGHAVVVGASMAGLLAARVLAGHAQRVTIVEKDGDINGHESRKGVPQGRHAHALLAGGARILQELFPGLFQDIVRDGGVVVNLSNGEFHWFHHGTWKLPPQSEIIAYSQTRPLLEWHVRQRVAAHPAVQFMSGARVDSLMVDASGQRVTGVQVQEKGGGAGVPLPADLVVDATGRGSRSSRWLETMGFSGPPETQVSVHLGYSSRLYQPPPGKAQPWKSLAVFPRAPSTSRLGVVFPVEGGRWLVTLGGTFKDYPPSQEEEFLDFARSLDSPEVYEAIREATPLSPVATYRFPSHLRRHFERVSPFPPGFLPIGDTLCSFNPIYGQGMSVCALEARVLDEALSAHACQGGVQTGLSREYLKRVSRIVDNAWRLATGADFLYPQTQGPHPTGSGLMGWYNSRVLDLCGHNAKVATRFHETVHFLREPASLFHPAVVLPVLREGLSMRWARMRRTWRRSSG